MCIFFNGKLRWPALVLFLALVLNLESVSSARSSHSPTLVVAKSHTTPSKHGEKTTLLSSCLEIPRGGGWIPGGWNPLGYKVTKLGEEFLSFDGSLESDVGRFLASLKERKRFSSIKAQWLEVVRASKSGQTMRVYRKLKELLEFCLNAGLVD